MWISYGSNNVAYDPMWVRAVSTFYELPGEPFARIAKGAKPLPPLKKPAGPVSGRGGWPLRMEEGRQRQDEATVGEAREIARERVGFFYVGERPNYPYYQHDVAEVNPFQKQYVYGDQDSAAGDMAK
jgi:hypothetical protein